MRSAICRLRASSEAAPIAAVAAWRSSRQRQPLSVREVAGLSSLDVQKCRFRRCLAAFQSANCSILRNCNSLMKTMNFQLNHFNDRLLTRAGLVLLLPLGWVENMPSRIFDLFPVALASIAAAIARDNFEIVRETLIFGINGSHLRFALISLFSPLVFSESYDTPSRRAMRREALFVRKVAR